MSTLTQPAPTKRIGELHFDHMEWLNSLRFYKEDLTILEQRLEDIVKHNTKNEVMAELEHFQNQFIREREVIDELRHDIKQHENLLEKESKEHPIAIDHRLFVDHTDLRDRMATYEKLFRELKADYHRWLAKRL
ncbi:MAG TPA: hypothetical protein PK760_10280 [Flavobacteriales bacterium]|nr:hypothetical protein [Flavobacteriales bacterium]